MDAGIQTKWMSWKDVSLYREQLIELEMVLIKQYHYPEMEIPMDYCIRSVDSLEGYLESGNTFFWGATKDGELIAYYWAYITTFINKKRWVLRSLMVRDGYQKIGLGTFAMREGELKALEQNCDEIQTEYVPWNEDAAELYHKNGFSISRVEVVKEL